jgi:quercetin dioxygenase-like cupin family protein
MKIIKAADIKAKQGPANAFVGTVFAEELISAPQPPSRLRVNRVTFTPGGRTNWHTHPATQTLHVLSGVGRLQELGKTAQELLPGDTAVIPPGVKHWHGAAPGCHFVHLALTETDDNGDYVVWLEPVSEPDYAKSSQV